MQIDNKLNWKAHIVKLKSKSCKAISIIYRCSSLINVHALRTLYCSLFLSQLTYCCEVWGTTYKSNLNCLYIFQKKSIRIIWKAEKLVHTTELFKNQKLLQFEDIVKHRLCCSVFGRTFLKILFFLQILYCAWSACVLSSHTKAVHCKPSQN